MWFKRNREENEKWYVRNAGVKMLMSRWFLRRTSKRNTEVFFGGFLLGGTGFRLSGLFLQFRPSLWSYFVQRDIKQQLHIKVCACVNLAVIIGSLSFGPYQYEPSQPRKYHLMDRRENQVPWRWLVLFWSSCVPDVRQIPQGRTVRGGAAAYHPADWADQRRAGPEREEEEGVL